MYCNIQEIELKKPNKNGLHKSIETYGLTERNGKVRYAYKFSGEKFERPIKTAYKITIHESRRVGGVVTKKQYAVATIGYYKFAESKISECISPKKVQSIADSLNTDVDNIWRLINDKITPIYNKAKSEFEQTDEYHTYLEYKKVLAKYEMDKIKFTSIYGILNNDYDYCYDIFGKVRNQDYLNQVIKEFENNDTDSDSMFNDFSSYLNSISGNYTDEEKDYLKAFYKTLAKHFHPDTNVQDDTCKQMALLNKLKKTWGI